MSGAGRARRMERARRRLERHQAPPAARGFGHLLVSFVERVEQDYREGRIKGWRICHDGEGWQVEVLSADESVVATGRGETFPVATLALIEGLRGSENVTLTINGKEAKDA